jgi:hypothetical protein
VEEADMTQDIAVLVESASALVAPYAARAGAGAAEEVVKELGAQGAHLVNRVWTALWRRAETSPDSRIALEVAARGGPAASGALQAPLMLVLQADADLAAGLADFLSRRQSEAAGFRATNVVMGNVQGDVVGRDQHKNESHRP